jgi:hypothetical protein
MLRFACLRSFDTTASVVDKKQTMLHYICRRVLDHTSNVRSVIVVTFLGHKKGNYNTSVC